ncbi:MAG: TetR/AcrR family transcriptional regulator [Candidatus Cloacimonadaceae bacterium]|nr:TetR/AcrR family transcriptional regulator [Candidatus Cloacimonadaceae bacterium]
MLASSEKKTLIIAAATSLFTRFGYTKSSMEEIANSAGIGKATIYYYFQCKEDIFLEVVRIKTEEFFGMLRERINASDGFEDKLGEFLRLPVKYINDHMPMLVDAMNAIPLSYQNRVEESCLSNRNQMYDILREIMDIGIEQNALAEDFDSARISQIINDWFLLTDTSFVLNDEVRLIKRIERDHEFLINMILYGIIKRG